MRLNSNSIILLGFLVFSFHETTTYKIESVGDALEYLSHFGYLSKFEKVPDVEIEDAREAVREFQDLTNLNPNGRLNHKTLKEMNKPRCGNRDLRIHEGDELGIDFVNARSNRTKRDLNVKVRLKKDDNPGVRWHKKVLTYRITKFSSSNLKPKTLQNEIDLAFKYWEREANLTFRKVWDGKADIEITFVKGAHGDEEPFDGPSKTLAHSFYPARGSIHFDDDEKWTANARRGHNLRTVAVHEIGHALGLGHSKEKKSVMYLMYQGFQDKLKLHLTDVTAIQSLYGPKIPLEKNQNEVIKSASKLRKDGIGMKSNPDLVDLCLNSSIDAISTLADGKIYIFKGDFYYRMNMGEAIDYLEYPKRINRSFLGLPGNLDTVLTISNGKTYFFKGKLYWRSTGLKMDKGYPKRIQTNFIGIPNNLDSAFVWSWNNLVYFFKKNRYWRYNFDTPTKKAPSTTIKPNTLRPRGRGLNGGVKKDLIPGYPKRISTNWPTIPDDIEDAFKAPNGRTYFFKGGEYWQFHDPDSPIEAESYPRSARDWWFGCTDFKPDARKLRQIRKKKAYNYI